MAVLPEEFIPVALIGEEVVPVAKTDSGSGSSLPKIETIAG